MASFVKLTGQLRRLLTGVLIQVVGAILVLVPLRAAPTSSGATFVLLGIGLGLGGFVLNCLWIRCPRCGAHVFWQTATSREATAWLAGTAGEPHCPSCGFTPDANS